MPVLAADAAAVGNTGINIDQSQVKVSKSEFDFDVVSVEKASAVIGKKKSKGKVLTLISHR